MQKLATAPAVLQKLQAKKNKKGFTLVELVIVIAILAILASIAIPVVISTINSANVSTFTSDTATMEMLLKAAINEQIADVQTTYTDGTSEVTTGGDESVSIAQIAHTNGFNIENLEKEIDGVRYGMVWDGATGTLTATRGTSSTAPPGSLLDTTTIDPDGNVTGTQA
ncbi:MAG: type II secretion system protein [Acutalibacteraceae bacterium]|nr:type II secretion system protein [Acutalibacteraceae bacterium]